MAGHHCYFCLPAYLSILSNLFCSVLFYSTLLYSTNSTGKPPCAQRPIHRGSLTSTGMPAATPSDAIGFLVDHDACCCNSQENGIAKPCKILPSVVAVAVSGDRLRHQSPQQPPAETHLCRSPLLHTAADTTWLQTLNHFEIFRI